MTVVASVSFVGVSHGGAGKGRGDECRNAKQGEWGICALSPLRCRGVLGGSPLLRPFYRSVGIKEGMTEIVRMCGGDGILFDVLGSWLRTRFLVWGWRR